MVLIKKGRVSHASRIGIGLNPDFPLGRICGRKSHGEMDRQIEGSGGIPEPFSVLQSNRAFQDPCPTRRRETACFRENLIAQSFQRLMDGLIARLGMTGPHHRLLE